MTIAVAIPWYGRPDLLQHCVDTVLAQTYRDIHVIVVGDGAEPPLKVRDGRLDVWHIPENRGTYYVHQLMLLASPHRWYAPVDADDCLSPGHLALMVDQLRNRALVAPNKLCGHADGRCEHRGGVGRSYGSGRYHVGLFRRDLMLGIGGYDPTERLGNDTMMLRLLRLAYPGQIRTVDDEAYLEAPTYHRIRRAGSLTRDPATNHASPARRAMKRRNRAVYAACHALRRPDRIRAYRASLIPAEVSDSLSAHVELLRARLGAEAAA